MDVYERHRRFWRGLYPLAHLFICRKFALTHGELEAEGPVLAVANHSCAWDPLLLAMALRKKQLYFVASEHLFRLGLVSRLLETLVAPIPRRKGSMGADTAKSCLRHLREGRSICIFAEGEQCWSGLSQKIFPATGKLARTSGASLATFRIEGGYLSLPRWGRGVRRGRVRVEPVRLYSPEELRKMTPAEVNAAIERDIAENAWERQRREPVPFRGRRRAEGMEQLLYLCPRCKKIGTLQTKNDRVFCGCGLSLRFAETGFFEPAEPFAELNAWAEWQAARLRDGDFIHGEPLFSDPGLSLTRLGRDHTAEELGEGTLELRDGALCCAGQVFPLKEIEDLAVVLCDRLLFSFHGDYYELRAKERCNLKKYFDLWKQR